MIRFLPCSSDLAPTDISINPETENPQMTSRYSDEYNDSSERTSGKLLPETFPGMEKKNSYMKLEGEQSESDHIYTNFVIIIFCKVSVTLFVRHRMLSV
jgi:hypothetical protein